MKDYVEVVEGKGEFAAITVRFDNEKDKPLAIGKKMNELCDQAYMNGYNWSAFLEYYLSQHAPDLLEDLDADPEGSSYFAHYPLTSENQQKAVRFSDIIIKLIENEDEIYEIIKTDGDKIEWD